MSTLDRLTEVQHQIAALGEEVKSIKKEVMSEQPEPITQAYFDVELLGGETLRILADEEWLVGSAANGKTMRFMVDELEDIQLPNGRTIPGMVEHNEWEPDGNAVAKISVNCRTGSQMRLLLNVLNVRFGSKEDGKGISHVDYEFSDAATWRDSDIPNLGIQEWFTSEVFDQTYTFQGGTGNSNPEDS